MALDTPAGAVTPMPTFFTTAADFRAWLEDNHDTASEVWVGFYKKGTGRTSIMWPEALDEALCFGWIDSARKSVDDESYGNRFTPRKPRSPWSERNSKRVEELALLGRMHPAGLRAFARRHLQRPVLDAPESAQTTTSSEGGA